MSIFGNVFLKPLLHYFLQTTIAIIYEISNFQNLFIAMKCLIWKLKRNKLLPNCDILRISKQKTFQNGSILRDQNNNLKKTARSLNIDMLPDI